MTDAAAPHPPCPVCGGVVLAHRRVRAGRAGGQVRLSLRCSAAGCHFRARLRPMPSGVAAAGPQATRSPGRPLPAWRAPLRTSGLLSLLALCVASPLAVVSLLGMSAVAGQPQAFGLPPGAQDDGRPVLDSPAVVAAGAAPAASPAPAHGLQLRLGCRWGQPGRAPYQGSTRQALTAAGLPPDVVAQIVAQQQAGQKQGRLAITRDGIRHTGDGRVFPARGLALTYGMTLCRDASVNFAKGHVEMADLYEARDAEGRLHAVMVPDVCGNVSVLGAQGQQGVVAGMSASLARRAQGLAALADALDPPSPAMAAAPAPDAGAGSGTAGRGSAGGENGGVTAGPAAAGDPVATPAAGLADAGGAVSGTSSGGVSAGVSGVVPGAATVAGARSSMGAAPRTAVPTPLAAIGAVTRLLVPPQAAGGVVRQLGRVTASAGRGVESLAGSLGVAPPVVVAGGGGSGQPVPEPGSLASVLLALAALVLVRARRLRRR